MPRPPLKPLSRALRVQPTQERHACSLTPQFEDLLFLNAELLSEGYCRQEPASGERIYSGSTMITVDLDGFPAGVGLDFRSVDLDTFRSVLEGSVRLRVRAIRLALAEVARRAPDGVPGTAQIETQVRLKDRLLHIDVELEVPILSACGQRHNG